MDDLELLIDLHLAGDRQGPGGDQETRLAIELSGLKSGANLRIADIGCGTGASTRVLASELNAHVTAVDFLPDFLTRLEQCAKEAGLGNKIDCTATSMDDLPFEDGSLDAIWSEGAIYNIGFENGIRSWKRFLKPGGILAVSELTWLTSDRPAELEEHWNREYPEVATAGTKIAQLNAAGYTPVGYFPLPVPCWLDSYYRPMRARFPAFLDRHTHSDAARQIVQIEEAEIDLYERHTAFVSYGYYIARTQAD